jgi:uncharacterized protein (TIGR02270 family)
MPAILRVLEQHVEQAHWLWLSRDRAVRGPTYALADLVNLDNRIDAHIEGLSLAWEAGRELCREELNDPDAGSIFTAAAGGLLSGDVAWFNEILEIALAGPELARGIVSALAWSNAKTELAMAPNRAVRRIAIAALAARREDPGASLEEAIADEDLLLATRAMRAAGELGRSDLAPLLEELATGSALHRFWSAWSSALLGAGRSRHHEALQSAAQSGLPFSESAIAIVVRRLPIAAAKDWIEELARDVNLRRIAIIGVRELGDPVLLPWLLEQMDDPVLARVCGEAFWSITGADPVREALMAERAQPTDEDDIAIPEADRDLPQLAPEAVRQWWTKRSGDFTNGTRYLLGQPVSEPWLRRVLRDGQQRQRAAAALELALRGPGQPLFNVAAPGYLQLRALGPALRRL